MLEIALLIAATAGIAAFARASFSGAATKSRVACGPVQTANI